MVEMIVHIAKVMGKSTVAEFVESDEVLGVLREIGVDYAQGYAIGKPSPFESVYPLIADVRSQVA
jgi:EAL domain-containing protein (putative c-di-GMP-specific phosphodiesterase class I)